ncbi:MAG: hypothetical protein ACLUKN_15885 [Bacilli bacterium]
MPDSSAPSVAKAKQTPILAKTTLASTTPWRKYKIQPKTKNGGFDDDIDF